MNTSITSVPPPEGASSLLVPTWVTDLASYRRWAHSDHYPQSGWVSYLDGEIFVDMSMEELLTHNQVKLAYALAVGQVLLRNPTGRFVGDRMLLSNVEAGLSTEPDGLYYTWATLQSGRLRLVAGKQQGYMELEGTPDMTLEVVSKISQFKDTKTLRELYWKANVSEYWLVDARSDPAKFDILRYAVSGYQATPAVDGWIASQVLGCELRIVRRADPLGYAQFIVETR